MSAVREFETEHKMRRLFAKVQCSCGTKAELPRPFLAGGRDSKRAHNERVFKQIADQFTRDGWLIGRRAQDDLCPKCVAATMPKKPTLTLIPKESVPMLPVTTNEPAEMTRDDGRVIFAKLEDVYDTNRAGYRAGWTDQKLATDLGVPRAWVEQVRKQFFGPEGGNPEIAAALAEAKALVEEVRPLLARLDQLKAQMGSTQAEAQKIAAKVEIIDRRIAAIEKAVRS